MFSNLMVEGVKILLFVVGLVGKERKVVMVILMLL